MSDSRRPNSFFTVWPQVFAAVFLMLPLFGENVSYSAANAGFNDGIDRNDPNFVTASLLIMSPGDELYSCAGHACIRLECPTFNLDYCFSYESESVKEKVLTFFMGKLKMGMFAIPTEDYLNVGRESGRGVMQYRLSLPPDAKQRLWKYLDDKVSEGSALAYDYMERGCAQAIMKVLREALPPYEMVVYPWPKEYERWARSEFLAAATMAYPWQQFILYTICGATTDEGMSNFRKVVIPQDLLAILKIAKIGGRSVIEGESVELISARNANAAGLRAICTPFVVSWFIVAVATANLLMKWDWMDVAFLTMQSLLGLFLTYMICFSNLTAMGWNWLIVPFNPLPLVFWKWRKTWALGFLGVLVLWEAFMIFAPHRMTDPAYLVLVGAYILFYLKFTRFGADALLASAKSTRSPVAAV